MSDTPDRKETALIPAGSTALTTRSSALVKRGLETLASLRGRVVRFPADRSMGSLHLYSRMGGVSRNLGDARGDVTVPPGRKLSLLVSDEAVFDLSPLASLRPDDLVRLILLEDEVFDEHLEHIKHLTFLEELWLYGQFSDAGLEHLGKLTGLRMLALFLEKSQATDAGFVHLKNLTALESLSCTSISNGGLAHVVALKSLRHLSLDGTRVKGDGLSCLNQLPFLNSLFISNAEIFDADIAKYIRGLTNLNSLGLRGTRVTDSGLNFLRTLTNLQTLDLGSCEISDSGLPFLQDLRSLQSLDLSGTFVTEKAVENLRRELPNCDIKK